MIVICTNGNWTPTPGAPIDGWYPQKDSLYEVIEQTPILFTNARHTNGLSNPVFYTLREDPLNHTRVWGCSHFREVDIDIKDVECEIVEEIEL